eukprot:6581740-Pyramimonas_sp.AAC.1
MPFPTDRTKCTSTPRPSNLDAPDLETRTSIVETRSTATATTTTAAAATRATSGGRRRIREAPK